MNDCLCNNRMPLGKTLTSRRDFLSRCGLGLGALGLTSLLSEDLLAQAKAAQFPARAKRVIHIFASGAPSQVDTWDPKPELTKFDGQSIPGHDGIAFGSPFKFEKKGQSGILCSEVFPKISEHVDNMAIIRSMYTDIPAHDVATRFMNTGSLQLPKPSLGSWVVYGL